MSAIRTVNMAWQLSGDARLLREAARGVDVLVLVECRDRANRPIDIAAMLGREWRTWQDLGDASLAGTVIAVRRDSVVRPRRIAGAASRLMRLSVPGRRVQARYLRDLALRDDEGPFTIAAAHLPLKSTGQQDAAEKALAAWWKRTRGRRAAFGDGNQRHTALRRAIGAYESAGADVMFSIWSPGWGQVRVGMDKMPGSDHAIQTFRN